MRPGYIGILTVLFLYVAGCQNIPNATNLASFKEPVEPGFQIDPSFESGLGAIANDQSADEETVAKATDWLLLGVKVARANGQDVWFIRLSSLGPIPQQDESPSPRIKEFVVPFGMAGVKTGAKFKAPASRVRIEMFDKDGVLVRSSVRTVPLLHSSTTMLDMFDSVSAALPKSGRPVPEMASVLTAMQLVGGSKALTPIRLAIRDHVITKPSMLAILLHGLKVKVEANINDREIVNSPWSAGIAVTTREEATFPLLVCGHRLFDCRVVVTPPDPPYNLTAGALLIEAVHPEKASNRLTVCVLAAKQNSQIGSPVTVVAQKQ